jgi:transcriptional regulator with XRE-family HTH domain
VPTRPNAPLTPPSRYVAEHVGARLKDLRQARGFTLQRLSQASGVPASTISKIENGQLRPSLVSAIGLAKALDENLGFLVDRYRESPEPVVVVRSAERDTIAYEEIGLTLQDLSGRFRRGVLEARVGVLAEGATSGVDRMRHVGEEFCLVLDGALRYRVGDDALDLETGEYVQFKSDTDHSWENVHRGETRVLWVFSDGLSF